MHGAQVLVAVHVAVHVQLDVFNVEKMGWEPLVDPWSVHVRAWVRA